MPTQTPWDHQITMRMLTGELTHEQGERAFRDPRAFKLSRRMLDGKDVSEGSWKFWGRIRTPRMEIAYCWSTKRNEAGYFLGWREVYEGKTTRCDEWTARKNKTRLKEFMLRRAAKALENGKASPRNTESVKYWHNILVTKGTLSKRKPGSDAGNQEDDED